MVLVCPHTFLQIYNNWASVVALVNFIWPLPGHSPLTDVQGWSGMTFLSLVTGREWEKIPKLGTGREWKNLFQHFGNWNQNPSQEYPRCIPKYANKLHHSFVPSPFSNLWITPIILLCYSMLCFAVWRYVICEVYIQILGVWSSFVAGSSTKMWVC